MRGYLVKRIAMGIVILYFVASLNFVLFQVLAPIDPTATIIDPDWEPEMRDALRALYGLDQELHIRYFRYIGNMFIWQFGTSFISQKPVAEEMSWRLANSVLLLGSVLIGTIMVGVPIGILAASRRGTKLDVATIGAGIFTWGVPAFFIQLLFQLFFSYYTYLAFGFQLFPQSGMTVTPPHADPVAYMADVAWHLAPPLITLVIAGFGSWALYTRNMMLDALTQDYITTARAKGLSERAVLYRHAFRSSLLPIVTIVALSVPGIVTGAIITEQIFTWPGIGSWYIFSLFSGDYPVVQSVMFVYGFLMIAANIVADILYGALDPRIRVGVRR